MENDIPYEFQQNITVSLSKLIKQRNTVGFEDRLNREMKQEYEKLMVSAYQNTIKRKEQNRYKDKSKVTCFEFPQNFPKLLLKEKKKDQSEVQSQFERALYFSTKAFPNPKYKVLKNFINHYQEIKKKTQFENMNVMGLQIKKIETSDSKNKFSKISDFQDHCLSRKPQLIKSHQSSKTHYHHKSVNRNQEEEQPSLDELSRSKQDIFKCSQIEILGKPERVAQPQKRKFSLVQYPSEKYTYYHQKVKNMKFNQHSSSMNKIYEKKINSYREYVFKMHLAHNVYLNYFNPQKLNNQAITKYKAFVGPGNNSILIKTLLKRRFWWTLVDDRNQQPNFVWTQIKVNDIFKKQKRSTIKPQSYKGEVSTQESQEKLTKSQQYKMRRERKFQQPLQKILTKDDQKLIRDYQQKYQKKYHQDFEHKRDRIKKDLYQLNDMTQGLVHNHLENNFFLGNKKAMFYNLRQYYELMEDNVFKYLPLTFHIKNGVKDPQYKKFLFYYKKRSAHIKKQEQALQEGQIKGNKVMRNIWIVKPGQLSNRGNGITVIDQIYQLNKIFNKKQNHENGIHKTYIVQLYIDRPLLYNRRKFDLRHYMLITNMFGVLRGYWYSEGYVRTASYEFDVNNFDREIHLTNDAVQKHTELHGKYEAGNKLSYLQLQRYLDSTYPHKHYSINKQILPKMKEAGRAAVRSAYLKISPNNLEHNFEILGLDFMIDQDFTPWLIEINTNPCLQLSCPLLQRLIPVMVQQSLRLTLDVIYPTPCHYSNTNKHLAQDMSLEYMKYQLIFDSTYEGHQVKQLYANIKLNKLMAEIGEVSEDEQFENQGHEIFIDEL